MTSARVTKQRSFCVIGSIGNEQWKRGEPIENLVARFRPGEALKEFLKNQACRKNEFAILKCPAQSDHMSGVGGRIAPQRERPDTGVNKDTQSRERSDL